MISFLIVKIVRKEGIQSVYIGGACRDESVVVRSRHFQKGFRFSGGLEEPLSMGEGDEIIVTAVCDHDRATHSGYVTSGIVIKAGEMSYREIGVNVGCDISNGCKGRLHYESTRSMFPRQPCPDCPSQ